MSMCNYSLKFDSFVLLTVAMYFSLCVTSLLLFSIDKCINCGFYESFTAYMFS